MRLLLVEDDIQLTDSLAEVLLSQRYVIDVAKDGEAGWCQMQSMDYDLALLDVTLPR
jgi:DNA-binding response OmpR family regulator